MLVLITSVICIFLQKHSKKNPATATVYVNGCEYIKINLNTAEDTTIPIILENGASNTIEVRHHDIRMLSGSCPNNLCVRQGWASESLVPIVCLPNNVVISVTYESASSGREDAFDAITY